MKKGKLHTLSKYEADRLNRAAFMAKDNIFDDGGNLLDLATAYYDKHPNLYDPSKDMIESYKNSKNIFGISKQANPLSKMNIKSTLGNVTSGVASVASPFITKALSNGYSTGVGNGISTVGNAVGDAIGGPYGAIVKVGAAALGGIYNAGMGVKLNDNLIANVKDNASRMTEAGNALAQANTNALVMDAAKNMGSAMSFNYKNLGSTGFLRTNRRLKREENRLNKIQNLALAKQAHGLMTGANQADRTTDDLANSTFIAAYGGPLHLEMNNIDNMGPTMYSLLMDREKRLAGKDDTSTTSYNYFGEAPSDNVFARGGGIHINPKNKGKFNATKKRTGKTTEELTHSKNPLTRKRAIFAQNARKWKHDIGGPLVIDDNSTLFALGGPEEDERKYRTIKVAPAGGGIYNYGMWIPKKIEDFETLEEKENAQEAMDSIRVWKNGLENNLLTQDDVTSRFLNYKKKMDEKYKKEDGYFVKPGVRIDQYRALGGPLYEDTLFALGGDLQTHGGDYSTGLTHVNAGDSHEMNPNEGVQMGVDGQGTPNLVEEGETIYNDYVYSARIEMDNEAKERFHINKKRNYTYAEFSKKLEKEAAERPNDPISQASLKVQLSDLADEQERQKAEMEAEKAKEAFEALSPEEQVAVMQQAQAQEQQAQEAAMQEQAMAEQQAMQQSATPEEAAMMQQQMGMSPDQMVQAAAQQQAMEAQAVAQPMMAYGGKINKFKGGGFFDWWKEYIGSSKENPNIDYNKLYWSITGKKSDLNNKQDVYNALREVYGETPDLFKPYDIENYNWLSLPDDIPYELGNNYAKIMEYLRDKYPDYYEDELNEIASEAYNKYQNDILTRQSKKWLKEQYPNISDSIVGKVASYMAKNAKQSTFANWKYNPSETLRGRIGGLFYGLIPTRQFDVKNYEQYINNWMKDAGLSFDEALEIASIEDPNISKNTKALLRRRLTGERQNGEQSKPSSEFTYLDFSEIPDLDVIDIGGSESYENRSDLPISNDSIISQFIKEKVKPSDTAKIERIFSNFTNKQKQAFINLNNDEEKQKFIIDASKNNSKQSTQNPVQKTTAGPSSTYRNVGKLKEDPQTAWRKYVLPGLNKFIDSWEDRINNASTQGEKDALIDQMVNDFNTLQKSYNDYVWPNIGKSGYYYDPKVESHQKDFSRNYGNTGFFVAQPDGTVVDAVGQAVDKAGSMGDNPDDGGIDGYNGPNTGMRNFGASMYGDADFYKPIIDRFRNLGVDYRLSEDLKNGDDALYVLSRRLPQIMTPEEEQAAKIEAAKKGTPLPDKIGQVESPGVEIPEVDKVQPRKVIPKLVDETDYGMYGPLVALGMQAMGIGKPDYTGLDRAQSIANRPIALASYQPIGDYVRYSPFDLWAAQNRLDANNRATQRAILNQYSPSRDASQIALAYAENIGAGQAQRQAAESNLAQKLQAAEFNRGTNKANADAFNAVSQFNAGQLNTGNRFKAQAALQDAAYRMEADAGWYNSIYGNVSNQFKNIAAREKEKRQHNMIARMAADGLFNRITPEQFIASDFVDWAPAANGGKLRRKKNKRRGLTI